MNTARLSAEAAADLVWKRYLQHGAKDMAKDDDPGYLCESCGHNQFVVDHSYVLVETIQETVSCQCGDQEAASERTVSRSTSYWKRYILAPDHHHDEIVGQEQVGDTEDEELSEVVHCPKCLKEHDDNDSNSETLEADMIDHEFYLRCAQCDHEIEFGWSHLDRGGRIWPVECSDFNPKMSFPEPRYKEAWGRRKWLRKQPEA